MCWYQSNTWSLSAPGTTVLLWLHFVFSVWEIFEPFFTGFVIKPQDNRNWCVSSISNTLGIQVESFVDLVAVGQQLIYWAPLHSISHSYWVISHIYLWEKHLLCHDHFLWHAWSVERIPPLAISIIPFFRTQHMTEDQILWILLPLFHKGYLQRLSQSSPSTIPQCSCSPTVHFLELDWAFACKIWVAWHPVPLLPEVAGHWHQSWRQSAL